MTLLIVILHILVCVSLILIVLLQAGKGADIGASMGGAGSQTLFGTTGATTMLSKITTGVAIIFMLTSLFLAYNSGKVKQPVSVMQDVKPAVEKTVPKKEPVTEKTAPVVPAENKGTESTETKK